MEKRLRSSLQASAEEFLLSATKFGFKMVKSSLKTLIWRIDSTSQLSSSLPFALHQSVVRAIESFKQLLESNSCGYTKSPCSPPTKRLRRSSRQRNSTGKSIGGGGDSDPNFRPGSEVILQDLEIYTYISILCISHPKKPFSPLDLLPSARALHDNLILFELDPILLSKIANLCEEWWKEQLPERETLISQFLPFLLSRSLTLQKKGDVRRVYALREAFSLFDFDDESIEDLKLLLVRCIITPLYLKTEEGRRFVVFLFGLSGQLVKEALAIIRSQIPFGRKSMLEAYAEILFRAWKVAEGALRDEIENGFFQGLIEAAIHASSEQLAASIRRVLGGFINQRTTDGVEKLLFRLAEPVIFRSLQVANSNVRRNALHLLLEMFPLEDPDATKEFKDALLDKQFFLMERLLMDVCPDVRAVAVEGSCRILHLFWEIIPSSAITKLTTKIINDMSNDVCNEVRLSTLNGIIYLLGNPQTHQLLQVLLPRLGHLVLDSVLSVRVALVNLLLILRDIRTFQFNKVVGLDVLLSTLANDQPLVAQKITSLLVPSYFPSKVTSEKACNRCVTLIKRSPMAGARFCEFVLSEGASINSLMELIKVFLSLVMSPDGLSADQIEGFLVAASHLCHSLASEASCKASLKELFSGEKLRSLFAAAITVCAQASVFSIASTISPDDVSGLLEECMDVIMNCKGLSENVERQAQIRSAHKLMLACDRFDDMFEALTDHLQKTANVCYFKFGIEIPKQSKPSVRLKRRKLSMRTSSKSKSVRGRKPSSSAMSNFEEDCVIAIGVAWQIKDLLTSIDTRNALLKSQVLELAFSALKVIFEVSVGQCMYCEYMDTTPVLAYITLAVHMTLQNISLTATNIFGDSKKDELESAGSSLELTVLDQSMNHVLDCTEKLFGASDSEKSSSSPFESKQDAEKTVQRRRHKRMESQTDPSTPKDDGSGIYNANKLPKMMEIFGTVLKLIVDAATVSPVFHNQERCLRFTSAYMQYMISIFRKHSHGHLQFREEDLKASFPCIRSSSSYAAKLLNIVLSNSSEASPPPAEASDISNSLLDLITLIELYMGSMYGTRLVASVKPWLPDLVLALGFTRILTRTQEKGDSSTASWISILGRLELCELDEISLAEEADVVESEFPAFKKLVEMVVLLLRGNRKVVDAVGVVFLTGSAIGLEREEFGLVLGLVHFVCVKLVRHEHGEWKELGMMLASLQEIYLRIERLVRDFNGSEAARQKLESAKELLEPVWMNHIFKL